MRTFTYIVRDKNGIHARPAGALISCAKKYESRIVVRLNGEDGELKEADGKRLLSIMSLGARYGDVLSFTVTGKDEEAAADDLLKCCDSL